MEKEQGGIIMAAKKKAAVHTAEAQKTEVKETAKAVLTAKTEAKEAVKTEVKEAPKAETKEAVKAEVKEAPKAVVKAVVKETSKAETKTAAKEAAPKAAKKPAAAKKTANKKSASKEENTGLSVVVEFNGTQRKIDEIVDKIKAEWVEAGHRVSSIKSLDVYIKPEDFTAYYVINGNVEGKVWM